MSTAANIEEAVGEADLVICAVLFPGARTVCYPRSPRLPITPRL
jgi:alanine dehydrogenase